MCGKLKDGGGTDALFRLDRGSANTLSVARSLGRVEGRRGHFAPRSLFRRRRNQSREVAAAAAAKPGSEHRTHAACGVFPGKNKLLLRKVRPASERGNISAALTKLIKNGARAQHFRSDRKEGRGGNQVRPPRHSTESPPLPTTKRVAQLRHRRTDGRRTRTED